MECRLHLTATTRTQYSNTIHALIYHQHTKYTLALPPAPARARIPLPTGRKFAPTVLETHQFTSDNTTITTTLPSTALVESTSPRRCIHPRYALTARLHEPLTLRRARAYTASNVTPLTTHHIMLPDSNVPFSSGPTYAVPLPRLCFNHA